MKIIDGAVNLRDFGGYPTQSGVHVKRDRLYRSGTLAYISEQGHQQFQALGVSLICDLRDDRERQQEPTPFPADLPQRLEIPIDPGSAAELRARLADAQLGFTERVQFMTNLTHELVRDHAEDYANMFGALLALDEGGFLVHCSAGKDRTGVACALILHALGVPQNTVIADYLFTNDATDFDGFVIPKIMAMYPDIAVDRELLMTLAGVREEYIQAAYGAIAADFNNVEHYIEDALRLSAKDLQHLRQRYLG